MRRVEYLNDIRKRKDDRNKKPVEESKEDNLKREIARFTTAIGVRVLRAKGDELGKLNAALALLNQAQMIVDTSQNEAKKLFAVARSLKSVNEVKDESRKSTRSKRRINENRKKNIDR